MNGPIRLIRNEREMDSRNAFFIPHLVKKPELSPSQKWAKILKTNLNIVEEMVHNTEHNAELATSASASVDGISGGDENDDGDDENVPPIDNVIVNVWKKLQKLAVLKTSI